MTQSNTENKIESIKRGINYIERNLRLMKRHNSLLDCVIQLKTNIEYLENTIEINTKRLQWFEKRYPHPYAYEIEGSSNE